MDAGNPSHYYESWLRHLSPNERRLMNWIVGFNGRFHASWLKAASGVPEAEVQAFLQSQPQWLENETSPEFYVCVTAPEYVHLWQSLDAKHRKTIFQPALQFLEKLVLERPPSLMKDEKSFRLALHSLGKTALRLVTLHASTYGYSQAVQTYQHYARLLEPYTYLPDIANRYLGLATTGCWLSYRFDEPLGSPEIYQELLEKAQSVGNLTYELALEALRILHLELTSEETSVSEEAMNHLLQRFERLEARSRERQLVSVFIVPLLAIRGDSEAVLEIYEKTLRPTEAIPSSLFPLLYLGIVAVSHSLTGHPSLGMGLIQAVRQEAEKQGYLGIVNHCDANMAYLFHAAKKYQEALKFAQAAQQHAGVWEDRITRAVSHAVLSLHALHQGNLNSPREWIGGLASMTLQAASLSYPDLFFELFFEAYRRGVELHPQWNMEHFCQIFARHTSKAHEVLFQIYQMRRAAHLDPNFWPSVSETEPTIENLKRTGLKLALGNFSLWLAKLAETRGRPEDLQRYGRLAYVALSGLSSEIFPERWQNWLKPEEKATELVSTILEISRTISSIRSLDDLYSSIVGMFGKLTSSEKRALFLVDEAGLLRLKAARNFSERLNVGVLRLIKQVAQQRRGEVLQGETQPGFQLCVPLLLGDRLLGVVYEENQFLTQAFSQQYLEILTTFGMQLAVTIDNVQAHAKLQELSQRLQKENVYYQEVRQREIQGHGIIGKSQGIRDVLEKISQVANLETSVLVTGETGVGKELVSACIHYASKRRNAAFVIVNCAAMSGALIENELFGHEKGAFTGADSRKIGRFELADQGTLFLDEIGELPLELQGKLLRVLQSHEFQRVGGTQTIRSNFRLVAATNRNLREAVRQGRFRQDLFYRLNVFPIEVPALRQRKEDIPLLAQHFIREFAQSMGKPIEPLASEEMRRLVHYDWPGNVRELRHVIERAVILNKSGHLAFDELHRDFLPIMTGQNPETQAEFPSLEEIMRRHILNALERCEGQIHGKGGAAELLEINPNTLRSKMAKLGIMTKKINVFQSIDDTF